MSTSAAVPRGPAKSSLRNKANPQMAPSERSVESRQKSKMTDLRHESMDTLLSTAAGVVKDACAVSNVFDKDRERKFPKFSEREVAVGKVIGRGGFCVVRNVDKIRAGPSTGASSRSLGNESAASTVASSSSSSCLPWLCASDAVDMDATDKGAQGNKLLEDQSISDERFSREYVAAASRKKSRKGTRYVLKSVSSDLPKITYMKGCVDIALEAKFLSALDHHNIIKLVAVSRAKPCTQGYFLILERMTETLGQRIKKWMDMDRQNKSVIGFVAGGKKNEIKLYREQIEASYDIANAMQYLHSKNIIFRDLKPENIGFDVSNCLKLFDFGLAKELLEKDRGEDGLYRNLTGCTGAVRYMAPEVGLGRPYNLTADSYSWSMLMWFMLALEPPYGMYSNKMIFDRVFRRGSRPAIFKKWNRVVGDILKNCWDADVSKRPGFLEISLCLKQELTGCEASAAGDTTVSYNGSNGEELNENS